MATKGETSLKITVLDGIPLNPGDVDWKPIQELGDLTVYDYHDPLLLAERVANSDIVLTNKAPLRKESIPALANTRLVGVLATGVNVVDIGALQDAGIPVCNVPAYGPEDVAQHALALVLELCRGTALHSEGVKAGEWQAKGWCYWKKAPLSLTGKKLGIIGFGTIGQYLGRYGHALGMEILAYSPHRKAAPAYPFEYAPLERIYSEADIISLHCPLTDATKNMINAETLKLFKPGSLLINTARGQLVDEQAAAEALAAGTLGGMGTDVLSVEPPVAGSPLFTAPNTLITPHMAWATARSRQNIINIMADNIRAFIGGKPINIVSA